MTGHEARARPNEPAPARLVNAHGTSPVLLVCEHASNRIPDEFDGLGLDETTRQSHVAWDPGALAVAEGLSARLDARLVASTVSRLVYDCNRPPGAADAMLARSELFDIPGNVGLSAAERDRRVRTYYQPFRDLLAETIAAGPAQQALVTVHSFTPVYMGKPRRTELGVLHDADRRMADEMLALAPSHCRMRAARNVPYGPQNGVTHTLKVHGITNGLPNVMLEIRNDLIAERTQQEAAADRLAGLIGQTLKNLDIATGSAEQA